MTYQATGVCSQPIWHYNPLQAANDDQATISRAEAWHDQRPPNQSDIAVPKRTTSYTQARRSVEDLESPQSIPSQNTTDAVPPQVDGPGDHHVATFSKHFSAIPATHRRKTSTNNVPPSNDREHQIPTVNDALGLLPWCTSEGRLRNDQAIALSDVGGSLKEVMLVALTAAVNDGAKEEIERAVGGAAAAAVIEFWNEEYAVD